MIRVADYVAQKLVEHGVGHVFLITGGGAMHLNDAIGRCEGLRYVCCHHEQACAIAAEGYARVTGQIGVANVTTGPGGTNALTGVLGQWLDSIPALIVSGQVRTETTAGSTGLGLRQLGDQEANIVEIVRSITKYAVMVTDPQSIRYHLEKALHLARAGRPGPAWIDIPLNVQAALVDLDDLPAYDPTEDAPAWDRSALAGHVAEVLARVRAAERPVLLAGNGIRLAGAEPLLRSVIEELGIPVQTAWNAIDLVPSDHPLFFGRPSTLGQRAANFIFQNSDLLLSIGCRLNTRQIGFSFAAGARAAFRISVDIDPLELRKPTFRPHLPIQCDAGAFLEEMRRQLAEGPVPARPEWLAWCRERRDRYPLVAEEWRRQESPVNPYVFCDALSDHLEADDVVVSSNGAACVVPIQCLRIKQGQRYIVNSGCAAMGYGLPAAIGACFAHGARVVCLEGDGSIQMNIQELQTLAHHQLPVKIFVFNNAGYLSIRTTQRGFFNGHMVGEGSTSGVSFPDMVRLAEAYGLTAFRIESHAGMGDQIRKALDAPGPVLCDVVMPADQSFEPRVTSQRLPDGRMVSKPLEDMYPFLDREEFLSNMLIEEWKP